MDDALTRAWFRRFLQYEPQLRAYLRRFLSDRADIADVIQESYARLLQLTDAERERVRSPRAFMFTTAHNAAVDHLRRRPVVSLDAMAELDASIVLSNNSPEQPVDLEVNARQELDRLERAMAALPRKCREVLRLRKILGFSQKEVAAQLGISEHTVEKQIARAVRLCTEHLLAEDTQSESHHHPTRHTRRVGRRHEDDSND
jgi:RNA polymerase sigma-70 factor (ECF subfamily)